MVDLLLWPWGYIGRGQGFSEGWGLGVSMELGIYKAPIPLHIVQSLPHDILLIQKALVRHQHKKLILKFKKKTCKLQSNVRDSIIICYDVQSFLAILGNSVSTD